MRALSIRQPYAELILRGVKTIEYRSRPTRIIGERFYIYASKVWAGVNGHELEGVATLTPSPSPAPGNGRGEPEFPTGVIVGSAVIESCQPIPATGQQLRANGSQAGRLCHPGESPLWEWHLADVRRYTRPRRPKRRPQPVWFVPF
jgi:hypothetical protein